MTFQSRHNIVIARTDKHTKSPVLHTNQALPNYKPTLILKAIVLT